jgi:uncharacterized protein DUF6084
VPDLQFHVVDAVPQPFAASPQLAFRLKIENGDAQEPIHTVALRCQILIEPTRRQYSNKNQQRLQDLFGEPKRWGQTLRSMLWTHTSVIVPSFAGSTLIDLQVPCTFDFNIAATKYFAGLDDGEIPLCVQFSGTVFHENDQGQLQVAQIPWNKETRYRLPVKVWQQMMDLYYPNSSWLCLRRDAFERLYEYKVQHGIPTWEQAIESLLEQASEKVVR